jgi:hypothetical protein
MYGAHTRVLGERNALELLINSFQQKIPLPPVVPFALRFTPDTRAAHIKGDGLAD